MLRTNFNPPLLYASLEEVVVLARAAARRQGELITFGIWGDDITATVAADSDIGLIVRDIHRALDELIPAVLPYPTVALTPEELRSDEAIAEQLRREHTRLADERYAVVLAQHATLKDKLGTLPPIDVPDPNSWAANHGSGTAEAWARLMQAEVAAGQTIIAVAYRTLHEAWPSGGLDGSDIRHMMRALRDHAWRYYGDLNAWWEAGAPAEE